MPLEMHGAYWSVHTQRVLFAAYEKTVADLVVVKPLSWDQRLDESYMKLQPFHKFPVLVDSDHGRDGKPFVLYESVAIILYLDNLFAGRGTDLQASISGDLTRRAEQDQWLSVESVVVFPLFNDLLVELVWGPALFGKATDQARVKEIIASLQQPLAVISSALSSDGRQYLAGAFGIVDVTFAPFLNRLAGVPAGLQLLQSFPAILAWWKRIEARPAWQKVAQLDASK